MNGDHDVIEIARQLRYDLTAMQAKVTDLLTMLAALNLPDPSRVICPECGSTLIAPSGGAGAVADKIEQDEKRLTVELPKQEVPCSDSSPRSGS